MTRLSILVLASLMLAACTEKPQTVARKADDKPWNAAASAYTAPGYQAGNEADWEAQMKRRAQGQNEYNRTTAR